MRKQVRLLLICTILILGMFGVCASVSAAALNKESVTIEKGSKFTLSLSGATASDWSSEDPSIASVSSKGKVTAKKLGTTYISCKSGYYTYKCMVTVVKKSTSSTRTYTTLLLDTSGSMYGTPRDKQKEAAKEFCKKILDSSGAHNIALITFGGYGGTLVKSFTSDFSVLSSAIDNIGASGGTPMTSALTIAKKELDGVTGKGDKYVVICSDGVPDNTSSAYTVDDEIKAAGYWVYALGFFHSLSGSGLDNAKAVMKRLASSESSAIVVTNLDDLKPALDNIAKKIIYRTITFNANGGSVSPGSLKVKNGSKWGTLPTPTRSGYEFLGWYTKKSGGTKITSSTKASKNLTVYAHWQQNKTKFKLTGVVKDAATGKPLKSATLKARSGYNNKTGFVIDQTKSDSNGKYTLNLEKGKFTIAVEKKNYTTNYFNINLEKDTKKETVITTKLASTQYRVVLTWGKIPEDLDAHLTGPNGDDRFHIFWKNKIAYKNGEILAQLDVDDRSSYGPETTTINFNVEPDGTYYYYVHDYSNRSSSSSTAMGHSGALVEVYKGSSKIAAYSVPVKGGTLWTVFKIQDGKLKKINSMSYDTSIE